MATAPSQPEVDGRFEVLSFLRAGRFGELWRAKRRHDGGFVTLKVLSRGGFADSEAMQRFQREVQVLRQFEHPSVLRLIGDGLSDKGTPFLVLEHQDGELLSDVLARGPLSIDRVRSIGAQIAHVVAAAGAKGIVHREISPKAILVSDGDAVKVLDFGLARALDDGMYDLTMTGHRLGDPTYMAPEYIEDFTFGHAADLYSLGALLYHLLAGRPPFVGQAFEVLEAHTTVVPTPIVDHRPDVPSWLDALVLALLSKRPEDRPDANTVALALGSGPQEA